MILVIQKATCVSVPPINGFLDFKVSILQSAKEGTTVEPLNTEETRLLALSVHVVRSIAEQHGGSLTRIKGEKKIQIYVPRDNRQACAEQIAEQLSQIRKQLLYPLVALSCGKIIVPLFSN